MALQTKTKKHYWNVFVVENEWKSKHCPKKNLRKTLGKSRELLIHTILKHSKKSGSKTSGWRNGIRLLQSTVSQWELVINILIWKKLFNVFYEVALQTVQSVIWKEINTQLNMLNIKFLSIIWKLTNSLSVTVGERGKSASHVFCIRVTMLLVLAVVWYSYRYTIWISSGS